jgi:hypothetical protein
MYEQVNMGRSWNRDRYLNISIFCWRQGNEMVGVQVDLGLDIESWCDMCHLGATPELVMYHNS